jgi:predicted metalloprotease
MRWRDMRQSANIEDRRGAGGLAVGGGIGGLIIAVIMYLLGGDPGSVQQPRQGDPSSGFNSSAPANAGQDTLRQLVAAVLGSTEDVWTDQFQKMGRTYTDPRLVLFTSRVQSACGIAGSASGPFYCPEDDRVYIDLSFYQELRSRFGAPGDFAQAYVIAHEVGHHVQNLLGLTNKMRPVSGNSAQANAFSVRLELQADFLAGVWAHYARERGDLDVGDVEEALNAASAIGDDKLQQESQGYVVPDAFTHGTSAQRARWFRRGLETGDIRQGDTFNATAL